MAATPRAARRLIFVNRFFYPDLSATSQMLFDLSRRLVRAGVEVHVVCSTQLYEDASARLPATGEIDGVRIHRIDGTRFGRARLLGRAIDYLSFYIGASAYLLRMSRSGDVLVAKTDPPLISVPVAAVARLRGAVLINWLQDIFPEVASLLESSPVPAPLAAVLRWARTASLRVARMNVVLGQRMSSMVAHLGVAPDRIRIVENWADPDIVTPMPARDSALRRAQALTDSFVVAYSGNLGRAHDYQTILDAARQLSEVPDVVFLMIGGGAGMSKLQAAVTDAGLRNFRFLPYQPREQLSDSLAAGDVHLACLLPALEGLIVPSKFYGILAAARPTVFFGDAKGELAQIIEKEQCGSAVIGGDGKALATALLDLKNDPGQREAQGRRARVLFENVYTADRAANQWLDLLGSLDVRLVQGQVSAAPSPVNSTDHALPTQRPVS